jgi:hypothetical protein
LGDLVIGNSRTIAVDEARRTICCTVSGLKPLQPHFSLSRARNPVRVEDVMAGGVAAQTTLALGAQDGHDGSVNVKRAATLVADRFNAHDRLSLATC